MVPLSGALRTRLAHHAQTQVFRFCFHLATAITRRASSHRTDCAKAMAEGTLRPSGLPERGWGYPRAVTHPTSAGGTTPFPSQAGHSIFAIAPSHHRTIAPSHHRTIAPSHHRTIAPSLHRTIAPSHHRTIAPSHHRTIAPSLLASSWLPAVCVYILLPSIACSVPT
jgi:hypothetical protein